MTPHTEIRSRRTVRAVLWLPGLLVAVGAAVATAHGLYEVARAAEAPPVIAALYPLITDGLALVAYAATARLVGSARRYAWAVVVIAAGLSGIAQASYLAHGVAQAPGALRFGVGAWPAIAAAVVAHLLYLIGTAGHSGHDEAPAGAAETVASTTGLQAPLAGIGEPDESRTVQLDAVQSDTSCTDPGVGERAAVRLDAVQDMPIHAAAGDGAPESSSRTPSVPSRGSASPARDKADRAAQAYHAEHGELPTVAALQALAEVSRGTAGEALKSLRTTPTPLHLIYPSEQIEAQS